MQALNGAGRVRVLAYSDRKGVLLKNASRSCVDQSDQNKCPHFLASPHLHVYALSAVQYCLSRR